MILGGVEKHLGLGCWFDSAKLSGVEKYLVGIMSRKYLPGNESHEEMMGFENLSLSKWYNLVVTKTFSMRALRVLLEVIWERREDSDPFFSPRKSNVWF